MSEDTAPARDYEVGQGKPPVHSQFKPGQSGNSRGRPKGSRNWKTIMLAALDERVVVTENGRQFRLTKKELMAKQLSNKAAKGHDRATEQVLKLLHAFEQTTVAATDPQGDETTAHGTPEDEEMFALAIKRLKGEG